MASTEQLERETEQTRARLAETLEELRSMTPGRVVDEVLDYAKTGGGDFLRNMGSKLGHQISENPLPCALIGAGIVWMMMSDGKAGNGMSRRATGDGRWSDSMYGTEIENDSSMTEKAGSAMRGVKETAQSAVSTVGSAASSLSETATSAYEAVSEKASRTAETVKSAASSVAESTAAMQESAMAATRSLFEFAKDQPLLLAGLGLAIGAALGAAIPETEAEERLMGDAAERVKGKAQRLASEQLHIAKQVGEHMVEETTKLAKQELQQVVGGQGQDQGQTQMGQGSASGSGPSDMARNDQSNLPSDQQGSETQNRSGDSEFNPTAGQPRPFH